jgi:endoglucanase
MRPHPRMRRLPAPFVAAAAVAVLCTGVAASTAAAPAPARPATTVQAAPSSAGTYQNPVAVHPWGIYRGGSDGLWPAYQRATGRAKKLLGRMALQPHVRWYTSFVGTRDIADKIRTDIAQEQDGNRNVVVWMATFRLWPHSEAARMRPLSSADVAAYKAWVRQATRGIGSSRVALVLEPDLPVAVRSWKPAVRLGMVNYAARLFGALPNATVYLDGGSADWLTVQDDASMLVRAGIRYVHGFTVGSTHHPSAAAEIRYARQVAIKLAKAGYPGKHFVVDTSDNGHGYTYAQFFAVHPHGVYNDPPACQTDSQRACISLGIPPTSDVTNAKWQLPSRLKTTLRRRCDAFMWIARPWMGDNGHAFNRAKALDVARTSPYVG